MPRTCLPGAATIRRIANKLDRVAKPLLRVEKNHPSVQFAPVPLRLGEFSNRKQESRIRPRPPGEFLHPRGKSPRASSVNAQLKWASAYSGLSFSAS